MQRVDMRSERLQTSFSKEYEKFFLQNNLVVSVPHVVHRWYIFDKKNTLPQIKQKIPNKMFLWVNVVPDSTDIVFNTITYFSWSQQQFLTVSLEMIFADINTTYFKETIRTKLSEFGYDKGIEINILSECERWSWVEFCWIIPVLLSSMIHILWNKVTLDQLHDTTSFENKSLFESIYTHALLFFPKAELDPSKTIMYTAMTNHWLPILGENTSHKGGKKKSVMPKNMQEEFHIKEILNQPMIDYGIINFGSLYDEYYINNWSKTQHLSDEIWSSLNDKLVKAWWDILKSPYDEKSIEHFVASVMEQWLFAAFVENNHTLFSDILFLFSQVKQFQDEKIWIMPLTSSKSWGSFLFVTAYKKSRETLEKLLNKLQEVWHHTAHYQYLSRIDWFTNVWLKVEQYVEKNICSPHIKDNNAIMKCCNWTNIIWNHRRLLDKEDNCIIFDEIDGKIYVDREATTHNEIITQSWTIDIMKILFQNIWSYVHNDNFPPSSYSKNKNEMVGKIICPLQDLVQKKFNEKLALECTGNIVDFDLRLVPNEVPLYFLKKIH